MLLALSCGLSCVSTNVAGAMFLDCSVAWAEFQLLNLKCGMFIVFPFLFGLWLFTLHKLHWQRSTYCSKAQAELHTHSLNPPLPPFFLLSLTRHGRNYRNIIANFSSILSRCWHMQHWHYFPGAQVQCLQAYQASLAQFFSTFPRCRWLSFQVSQASLA